MDIVQIHSNYKFLIMPLPFYAHIPTFRGRVNQSNFVLIANTLNLWWKHVYHHFIYNRWWTLLHLCVGFHVNTSGGTSLVHLHGCFSYQSACFPPPENQNAFYWSRASSTHCFLIGSWWFPLVERFQNRSITPVFWLLSNSFTFLVLQTATGFTLLPSWRNEFSHVFDHRPNPPCCTASWTTESNVINWWFSCVQVGT